MLDPHPQRTSVVTVVSDADKRCPILIDPSLAIVKNDRPSGSLFGPEILQNAEVRSDVPVKLVPLTREEFYKFKASEGM
jgi:hypothetical protein